MSMTIKLEDVEKQIQARLVAKSLIATDVRGLYYQGQTFAYPAVRHDIISFEPASDCGVLVNFAVYAWSESTSPLVALQILDQVIAGLHDKVVTGTPRLQNIKLVSAPRLARDRRLWRGEAYFRCQAN